MRELSIYQARMRYIQGWQRLPQFGRTFFLCRSASAGGAALPASQSTSALHSAQARDKSAQAANPKVLTYTQCYNRTHAV